MDERMQGTMTSLILAETWKMDVIGGWISLVTLFELGGLGWLFLFELNFLNEFVSLINGFMSCLYFSLVRLNLEKYNESSFSVYIYICKSNNNFNTKNAPLFNII
ncbi:hypothetical protein MANES_15G125950v8 [Manihot esculenta]|uniref:Uncharacterized protein n=1 Tax=Manihot esculenta TaxID=3983 RepID=A0ACB7GCP5_MANES|nr:hypothetical protein MANES_15G125950v8 [Manihot esculenta]